MSKTRVVLCGQRLLGQRCAEFLHERHDTEIVAIVTAPGDWQADLAAWGVRQRLKVFAGNANLYRDELRALEPDFLFSIVYSSILKGEILAIPRRGALNLHPGLLPRYAGCHPVAWSILNGERHAGATLHYMTEKVDMGDIVAQAAVPIGPETTAGALYQQVTDAAFGLFASTYPLLLEGKAGRCPQDPSEIRYYSYRSLDFQEGRRLAFDRPTDEIVRRARAFTFETFQVPVGHLRLPDGQVLVVNVTGARPGEASAPDGNGNACAGDASLTPHGAAAASPGRVVGVSTAGGVLVATGDGTVELGCLEGRPAAEFIRSLAVPAEALAFESQSVAPCPLPVAPSLSGR